MNARRIVFSPCSVAAEAVGSRRVRRRSSVRARRGVAGGAVMLVLVVTAGACSSPSSEASKPMRVYRLAASNGAYNFRLRVTGQASLPGLAQLGALAGDAASKPVAVVVSADATQDIAVSRAFANTLLAFQFQQLNGSVSTTLGRRGLSQKDLERTGSTGFRQTITPLGQVTQTEKMPAVLAALPGVVDLVGFGCPQLPADRALKPGDTWTVPAADGRPAEENAISTTTRQGKPVVELKSHRTGPVATTADVGQVVSILAGFDIGAGTTLRVAGTSDSTTVCTLDASRSKLLAISATARTEVDLAVDGNGLVASVLNGGHLSLAPDVQREFDISITPTSH